MTEFIVPRTPYELALPTAEELVLKGSMNDFDDSPQVLDAIRELDELAKMANLTDQSYLLDTVTSIVIPKKFDPNESRLIQLPEGSLEGEFKAYGSFYAGRGTVGHGTIRAFCLMFDNVTILDTFETISEDEVVFVPIFSIKDIDKLAS
jgi:hypothetical protein